VSVARDLLLWASRSPALARNLRHRAFVGRAVARFMPGEEFADALAAARRFAPAGIGTVFTKLGENISTLAEAEAVRDHYLDVLGRIADQRLDAQVSVKLTQLGLDVDRDWCERAVGALAERAAAAGGLLWIDMEDSHYTDVTLDVFRRARAATPDVGVCLQAYLRRTPGDLDSLLPLRPAIRLVKGAYAEPPAAAFPRKADVDAAYFRLAERLLERAAHGAARPVFGTHDMRLVARIGERAGALGVAPSGYEHHLLYGIREAEQRALAAAGKRVRVLISYGSAWFAWYMRRLAERPANVWFALRMMV
jgi:proline dehydrogenase